MSLLVCESCNRHVAASTARCPFCRASLVASSAAPKRALEGGRGALLAAGLVTANLAGCTESILVSDELATTSPDASIVDTDSSTTEPGTATDDAGVVAPPVDPGDWIPTPIYEAIPPRR